MTQILVVEDEINVRKPLVEYLVQEGFKVIEVGTLSQADEQIKNDIDLVLLDWMLPDGQGIESLKKWRRNGIETPIILLTARAELVDKVVGLELGAHDYITKPFEPRELVARIRVQIRGKRVEVAALAKTVQNSGIILDLSSHDATFQGKDLELTKTEFELLRVFLENPNQVFSREEFLKRVWGYDQYPSTRTVDTHVLQLRQKTRAEFFETVHGIGYRFRPAKDLALN